MRLVGLGLVFMGWAGCAVLSGRPSRDAGADDPVPRDRKIVLKGNGYRLGFVEFDEQGEFRSRKLFNTVLSDLAEFCKQAKRRGEDPLVFVYVHGWQNNARSRDVRLFETQLKNYAATIGKGGSDSKRKAVYGVYLAWPGRLVPNPNPDNVLSAAADTVVFGLPKLLTFWTREAAGARIGKVCSTEALLRISSTARQESPFTRVVFIGHSFGALVLETSMAQAYLSRLYDRNSKSSSDGDFRPPADLVLLINQAAPGLMAKEMQEAFRTAYGANPSRKALYERPLIVSITTTDDGATGMAFPWARFLGNPFYLWGRTYGDNDESVGRSQFPYYIRTAGHTPKLHTHEIRDSGRKPFALPSLPIPFLTPQTPAASDDPTTIRQNLVAEAGENLQANWSFVADGRTWNVNRRPETDWKTPYWIVSVNKDFIQGHGGFWTPNVEGFLTALLARNQVFQVASRPAGIPLAAPQSPVAASTVPAP